MSIESMTFEEKVELLKQLLDDLPITLTATYGETAQVSSEDVSVIKTQNGEVIEIWTGICTG